MISVEIVWQDPIYHTEIVRQIHSLCSKEGMHASTHFQVNKTQKRQGRYTVSFGRSQLLDSCSDVTNKQTKQLKRKHIQ